MLLRANNESLRAAMESDWMRRSKPVHVGWMFELWLVRSEAEVAWCERIAERVEAGVSYLPDGLSVAEGWEAWADRAPGETGPTSTDGADRPDEE
jgi:hypothetical protein